MRTETGSREKYLRGHTWALLIGWTIILVLILILKVMSTQETTADMAINEARAHFSRESALRSWASSHGGVYVPLSEATEPNPYLSHVPERDIVTPSGKSLTLMNPAYMMRQVNEYFSRYFGIAGHITSLKLMRPENAPDEWEQKALKVFDQGEPEYLEFTDFNGKPYLRLMQPLVAKKNCLKCHAHQGYKEGEIRGGISISVPMAPFISREKLEINEDIAGLALLWLLGLCGIVLGERVLGKRIRERDRAQEELHNYKDNLEEIVKQRTAQLSRTVNALHEEVNERRKAEEELSEKEEHFRKLSEATLEGIMITEKDILLETNQTFADMFGYDRSEVAGIQVMKVVAPESHELVRKNIRSGFDKPYESVCVKKSGEPFPVEVCGKAIHYKGKAARVTAIRDITELKKAEEQIRRSLKEKEVLLQEIHHRVKNNMTVVSSLLKLQSDKVEDERYREMFYDCMGRIRTMASVHDKLYQAENMDKIIFSSYIRDMAEEVFRSYDLSSRLKLITDVDDITLGIAASTPCGLIVNELITNALKYAFPEDREGEIVVALYMLDNDEIEMTVSDNGVGIPEEIDFSSTDSLGLSLIKALVMQLQGNIELKKENGTEFKIIFRRRE
jgi:PAS domain S-box-containing protein